MDDGEQLISTDWEKSRCSSSCACSFLCEYLSKGSKDATRNLSRDSRYHNRHWNRMLPDSSHERIRSGQLGRCLHYGMILM